MTILIPILAGIGALCMSNPGKRRRTKRRKVKSRRRVSRRRNPYGDRRDYRKIDIFVGGNYVASTTWAKSPKEAIRHYKGEVATTSAEKGPHIADRSGAHGKVTARYADKNPGRRRVIRRRNPVRMGTNMKNALAFVQRNAGWQTYKSRDQATRLAIRKLAKLGLVETAHTGQFSEYRLAQSSNPGKRRKGKRKGKWQSPGSAASRLAWWRWHSNPKPRDLTEHEFTRGKGGLTKVTVATWRNANATAFIAVTASGPGGVKTWEAKSQGPSSGGYSKPDQAAERMVHKITGKWPHEVTRETGHGLLKVIADLAAEKLNTRSNPRRRKSRRKSRR